MQLEHGKLYVLKSGLITPPMVSRHGGSSFETDDHSLLLWTPDGVFIDVEGRMTKEQIADLSVVSKITEPENKPETVQSKWESFSEVMFKGLDVSDVQRDEMKKAFFAGSASMLGIVLGTGDPDISDEQRFSQFYALEEELSQFMKNELEGGTDDLSESQ